MSVDEAIDYSATDEEVKQHFTNLINYMNMNNLSVNDLMMENNITTESTLHVTNYTTNFEFTEAFTPVKATDDTHILTTSKTLDDLTETGHITAQWPMTDHLMGTNPVQVPYNAATGSAPMPFDPNNSSIDEDLESSPTSSLQDESHVLGPDGEHSCPLHVCDQLLTWPQGRASLATSGAAAGGVRTTATSSEQQPFQTQQMFSIQELNCHVFHRKHLQRHDPQLLCEAEHPEEKLCFEVFADDKGRNRHYWVSHKDYAKKQNIPETDCCCEHCKKTFSRKDNLKRHLDRFAKCREAVERMRRTGRGS